MNVPQLNGLSAEALAQAIRGREIRAEAVMRATFDALASLNGPINAFVTHDREAALEAARRVDIAIQAGETLGELAGVPLAIKDNCLTTDFPSTAGSHVRGTDCAAQDATSVARLRAAGAIVVGKTNMHEWAYGATNAQSRYGACRNPWDTGRISGGSSGGSAAAVAARIVPAALGTDTGGSVRIPAAACGVSGIKPTHGLVSRHGVLPLAWSFDCVGPIARSAADLHLLLRVLAGPDAKDPTTEGACPPPRAARRLATLCGLRIGVLDGVGLETSADVGRCVNEALALLAADGAAIETRHPPDLASGFAAWKVIMHAEASAWHRNLLDRSGDAYSAAVRSRLEAGRSISAVDYLRAQQYRNAFLEQCGTALGDCDAWVLPTLPIVAPLADETDVTLGDTRVSVQDAMTRMPWLANFTGMPCVSLPCGIGEAGAPVGLSLLGRPGTDFALLEIGIRFQQLSEWHTRGPAQVHAEKALAIATGDSR
ncbi:amidase [Trinickia acidisoli]|uniref:amidase n=1 Tax=Trinickia acidisoli TaxID=2767482 RepID=UPI001A8C1C20|nr:amidase [Trinickia acidisoli]